MLFNRKFTIFAAAVSVMTLIAGANIGFYNVVNHGLEQDVLRKAENWGTYSAAYLASQNAMSLDGEPGEQDQQMMRQVSLLGDVFELSIYDSTGALYYQAGYDDRAEHFAAPGQIDLADVATASSVGPLVEIHNGDAANGEPLLYASAVFALQNTDGETIGAIRALVDESQTASAFFEAAIILSITLSVVFGVVLVGVWAGLFYFRRRTYRAGKRLDFLAQFDELSGLHNRAGFLSLLKRESENPRPIARGYALLYLDIDNFKAVNDTHGHEIGDAFIRHVGQTILSFSGEAGIAGRLGGDEFALVLPANDASTATALAEELRIAVSQPFSSNGRTLQGTISLGAHFQTRTECRDPAECLQKADLALYQSKADGRNRWSLFSPELERQIMRHRKIEDVVRRGLKEELFAVHYQPLIESTSGKCVGLEALLRLTTSEGEPVSPVEFIPIAESTKLINEIGAWIIREAANMIAALPEPLFVAVNLSPQQFKDGQLVPQLKQVVGETGISADRMELEVTESLLMENTDATAAQLAALRDFGFRIAMDDFGTGYSSLGYLWKFGFDKLKIDRSFVLGLGDDEEKARDILDSVILLGHRLDMTVTAEGIENDHQAEVLSNLSCDQFQGYLYSKPIPATEVAPFILRNFQRGTGTGTEPATGTPTEQSEERPAQEG